LLGKRNREAKAKATQTARRGPYHKPIAASAGEIEAKRAKAYADMESHLCDVVRMGEIASSLFDCSDQGLFVFAVGHLEEMLLDLRKRYYALDFPL
jgi:hypothetical protein